MKKFLCLTALVFLVTTLTYSQPNKFVMGPHIEEQDTITIITKTGFLYNLKVVNLAGSEIVEPSGQIITSTGIMEIPDLDRSEILNIVFSMPTSESPMDTVSGDNDSSMDTVSVDSNMDTVSTVIVKDKFTNEVLYSIVCSWGSEIEIPCPNAENGVFHFTCQSNDIEIIIDCYGENENE